MSTTLDTAPASDRKAAAPKATAAPVPTWTGSNRRTSGHVIDVRRQLPGSLATTLTTLLLLLLLNLVLDQLTAWNTREILSDFPELEAHITRANSMRSGVIYAFSGLLTVSVCAASLRRQHRTLGPIVNFRNCMKRVGEGDLSVRVKLRKDDHLLEIQESFNTMMDAIDLRTRREMATLEGAMAAARQLGPPAVARDLVHALEDLRSDKERALGRNRPA
jgi:methyl-accepting chemotaxis protein